MFQSPHRPPRFRRRALASTCALFLALLLAVAVPSRSRALTPTPSPSPAITATAQPTATPMPLALSLRAATGTLREGGQEALDVFLAQPLSRDITVTFFFNQSFSGGFIPGNFGNLNPIFVPSATSLTLRAGQTRGRIVLRATEDSVRYGYTSFVISASVASNGFAGNAGVVLQYRDNDAPRISLRANGDVWREGSGAEENLLAVSSNVRQSPFGAGAGAGAFISLRSSRPDIVQVPPLVVEGPNVPGLSPVQVLERPGFNPPVRVTITASAAGARTVSIQVIVVDRDAPGLALSVSPSVIDEDSLSPARGVVYRAGDKSRPLTVTLRISDVGLARLPAGVTIPAGSDRVSFAIAPIERRSVDVSSDFSPFPSLSRPLEGVVSASAGLLASARARLLLRDSTPFVDIQATPDEFFEENGNGGGVATLRLARPRGRDLPVVLRASDRRIVLAQSALVLPRDGSVRRVPFRVLDDKAARDPSVFEEPATISVFDGFVRASLSPTPAGSARVRLADDDTPLLLRVTPDEIQSGASQVAFEVAVVRQGDISQPLDVSLSASDITGFTRYTLPASVRIEAGERIATVRARAELVQADVYSLDIFVRASAPGASGGEDAGVARVRIVGTTAATLAELPSVDVLSPSAPTGYAIVSLPLAFEPATLVIRPVGPNSIVATAPSVRLRGQGSFVAIPLRLLRAPTRDTAVEFSISSSGSRLRQSFFVQVRAEPPLAPPR